MINKDITDITYDDINLLKQHKIPEGDTLEYKSKMIQNSDLIKQVCAFANTRGGDIIFGVKESGSGGYPVEICGLDDNFNKEQVEQVILSNLNPRLNVEIKTIKISDSTKIIAVIRIPDSNLKPHQSNMDKKFYKRFQFESTAMTEQEICDYYKGRFGNHDQVEKYIEGILSCKPPSLKNVIELNIIIIPSSIKPRLIKISNDKEIEWFHSIDVGRGSTMFGKFLPSALEPFSDGLISKDLNYELFKQISIHRNGCIQHIGDFWPDHDVCYFRAEYFAVKLMHALKFANTVLQHYNYSGRVTIIVRATCPYENRLPGYSVSISKLDCKIQHEYLLQYVETHHEEISSSIMDEIYNHYSISRCDLFDANGRYLK